MESVLEPPSVLILTKDEAVNIAACLECLRFTDDIVVLDSFSSDQTIEIAQRFPNVRVIRRHFDTEYKQRNFGLHAIEYRHKWLYICDADERLPGDVIDEMLRVTNDPSITHVAYRLRYKNFYRGHWLKHASGYPVWIMRLLRPGRVTYEVRETNIHPIVDGTVGVLQGHFLHYSFNKGLVAWFQKHNFYSQMEANEAVRIRSGGIERHLRNALNKDWSIRRRALKNLSFFIPFRAPARFVHMYLIKGGFRDGTAGFHYAAMVSLYEYWITLKIRERRAGDADRTRSAARRILGEAGGRGVTR